jgi:hypothetical protein
LGESRLTVVSGRQDITSDGESLKYGVSVTDACVGWAETEAILEELAASVQKRHKALRSESVAILESGHPIKNMAAAPKPRRASTVEVRG